MQYAILTRTPWKIHRSNITLTSVKRMWWQHTVVRWRDGKSTEVASVERRSYEALSAAMFKRLHMHSLESMRLSQREGVHVCVCVCVASNETKKTMRLSFSHGGWTSLSNTTSELPSCDICRCPVICGNKWCLLRLQDSNHQCLGQLQPHDRSCGKGPMWMCVCQWVCPSSVQHMNYPVTTVPQCHWILSQVDMEAVGEFGGGMTSIEPWHI